MRTRNRNIEQIPTNVENKRRGSSLNSFLGGAATVLVLLALGMGSFLLYRAMKSRQVRNSLDRQNKNSTAIVVPTPAPVTPSAGVSTEIPQNPYIQTALDDKAQVELLSVTRVPEKTDEVNVQVRVRRLTDRFAGSDIINMGATIARNPFTSETYEAVDPVERSSGPIFMFSLRENQTGDGYVVLKVPAGVNAIDISIKDTGTFKNVLISHPNSVANTEKSSSVSPSTQTTTPETPPTLSVNTANSNSNLASKTAVPTTLEPTPKVTLEFQPGAFKQLAYGTKAEVDLLWAKRIQDPETGNRDVVNVQMRIRRLVDKIAENNTIDVGKTTARNPVTSETYKAVNSRSSSTGTVSLFDISPSASVDAYVWLRVPPNVNTLDIYIPETGAIKSVPISN